MIPKIIANIGCSIAKSCMLINYTNNESKEGFFKKLSLGFMFFGTFLRCHPMNFFSLLRVQAYSFDSPLSVGNFIHESGLTC